MVAVGLRNPRKSRKLLQVTNFVTFNGNDYATITNVDPSDTEVGCESTFTALPSGWEIPSNTADAIAVAKAHVSFCRLKQKQKQNCDSSCNISFFFFWISHGELISCCSMLVLLLVAVEKV